MTHPTFLLKRVFSFLKKIQFFEALFSALESKHSAQKKITQATLVSCGVLFYKQDRLNEAKTSRNLDRPEGSLDALVQVLSCQVRAHCISH